MRPSREAFDEAVSDLVTASGRRRAVYVVPERAAVEAHFDAQEAQIRELADALEAVLSYHQECRFVEEYPYHGQCEAHDWIEQTAGACVHKTAREALIKARGDK